MKLTPAHTRLAILRYRKIKFSIPDDRRDLSAGDLPVFKQDSNFNQLENRPFPFSNEAVKQYHGSSCIVKEKAYAITDFSEEKDSYKHVPGDRGDRADEDMVIKKSTAVTSCSRNCWFSGQLSESIDIRLRDSDQCMIQYRLSPVQRADFFIIVLVGDARTFFLTNVSIVMNLQEIRKFMLDEHNSNSRQIQLRRILQSLSIFTFMPGKNISSPAIALSSTVVYINRLSPLFPLHSVKMTTKYLTCFRPWSVSFSLELLLANCRRRCLLDSVCQRPPRFNITWDRNWV